MNRRFAVPLASAATAILLLGACGGDEPSTTPTTATVNGPTTLVKADDVHTVESPLFGVQTLDIIAEEDDANVTGAIRYDDLGITVNCANTETNGVIILGGEVTDEDPNYTYVQGDLLALLIRAGSPDKIALTLDIDNAGSCAEFLEAIPEDLLTSDSGFQAIADGDDIQTG